jgi:mannose-6-phosphate isomerase-like protein (cupin superfamily)
MSFKLNIEQKTVLNKNYRKVVYTDKHQQIVLMSLAVGEYIHCEKHNGSQFFRVESGVGMATVKNKKIKLYDGVALAVPRNMYHMIVNTSKTHPLKLYTIYSPPQHIHGEINKHQPNDEL